MSSISQCRAGLGTYVKVSLCGDLDEDVLLGHSLQAFAEIQRIERLMSFHDPASELSRINRCAYQEPVPISVDMATVLRQALELSRWTAGQFDLSIASSLVHLGALPDHGIEADRKASWQDIRLEDNTVRFTRPLQLDLGGIAKGYAVDCAFSSMDPEIQATVNAGGDLRMRPWRGISVAVRVPRACEPAENLVEVPMRASAIATSASYFGEGRHPVISPTTQLPIHDVRSVSVFASSCMLADALTKVVFLARDCTSVLDRLNAEAIVIDTDASAMLLGGP